MKKASEVIKEIKKLKRKHGDIYVETYSNFWGRGINITDINVIEEDDYKYIKIK